MKMLEVTFKRMVSIILICELLSRVSFQSLFWVFCSRKWQSLIVLSRPEIEDFSSCLGDEKSLNPMRG